MMQFSCLMLSISHLIFYSQIDVHDQYMYIIMFDVCSCLHLGIVLLCSEQTEQAPDWNFWKYLIDHRGNVIGWWGPQTSVNELSPSVRKAVGAASSDAAEPSVLDDSLRSHPNTIREL